MGSVDIVEPDTRMEIGEGTQCCRFSTLVNETKY